MWVQVSPAHSRVHLRVVKPVSTLFLHLFGVLAKVSHFLVLFLELFDARLLADEVLLPLVKDIHHGQLLWISSNCFVLDELVVHFKTAILWPNLVPVDAREASLCWAKVIKLRPLKL